MKNDRAVPALLVIAACVVAAPSPVFAHGSHGGSGPAVIAGLKSPVPVGSLRISIDRVGLRTCLSVHGRIYKRAKPGWVFVDVDWVLSNPTTRRFSLPHPNHPGFRLVGQHRLFPGFYASYPGYSSVVFPRSSDPIPWTFAVPRRTKRIFLTYVPPGPRAVLWSIPVPQQPVSCANPG